MISANRHREEHDYMVARRMQKEGVAREDDLKVPARFVLLEREGKEIAIDPLNPHLMLMSTSQEGDKLSRQVTAAVTRFVNENVAAAIEQGVTNPLPSVARLTSLLVSGRDGDSSVRFTTATVAELSDEEGAGWRLVRVVSP